jgi:adenine-specific DNA-methyltransferase
MMYPRLFLARQLLREDGVIFVSIDDHEVHNLRLLMNEVFGEENFIAQITIQSNPRGRQAERFVATVHEHVLVYARSTEQCVIRGAELTQEQIKEFKYQDETGRKYRLLGLRQRGSASRREDRPHMFFPLYVDPITSRASVTKSDQFSIEVLPKKSTGEDGRWMWGKETVQGNLDRIEARLIAPREEWDIFVRDYLVTDEGEKRERKFKTIWDDKALNYQNGTRELKEIFNTDQTLVEYPKPTYLLKQVIVMAGGGPEDIYLDFFAGSCTVAQAALELNREDDGNRRFIMVQLPEPTSEGSPAKQAGYENIAAIGKERIRRVIAQMQREREGQLPLETPETPEDLGFKVFKLAPSNYQLWRGVGEDTPDAYAEQMALFADPLVDGWTAENVIYEVALKEGYGLNCRITPLPVPPPLAGEGGDRRSPGRGIYRVTDPDKEQSFTICLENAINLETLSALNLDKDDLFICRDVALDDEAAANLALQCRLKTI